MKGRLGVWAVMVGLQGAFVGNSCAAAQEPIAYLPYLAAEGGWNTRLVLVNTAATSGQAQLSFFDEAGRPLSLPIGLSSSENASLESSVDRTIAPGAISMIDTSGSNTAAIQSASAQLSGDPGIGGFAILSFPEAKWDAVVPLESTSASAYYLAFDNTGALATGVAVTNLSMTAVNIPVTIRDDTGALIATSTIDLPVQGHTKFMLAEHYPGTANIRGTIELETPVGARIAALGLRSNGTSLTTLPILANTGATGGSIAHATFNGGFASTYYVANIGTASNQFTLSFFDDNGGPLTVPLWLPQSGTLITDSTLTRTLEAGSLLEIDAQAQDRLPSVQGSAQLTATSAAIGAFQIFRWMPFGQEASVPMESRTADSFVLVFDNTGDFTTGVAVANASGVAGNIVVNLRDDSGTLLGTKTIALAARGHTSFMLPAAYALTAARRGTAEFVVPAGGQISVIGLRAAQDGRLTTIPLQTKMISKPAISQLGQDWTISFSSGLPKHPSTLGGGSGWSFNFPIYDDRVTPCWKAEGCSYVGYIRTIFNTPLEIGQHLNMSVEISGVNPVFRYQTESGNTCTSPAQVRLLLERKGDDLTQEFYRWWSNPQRIVLTPGSATITVAIDPSQWSSVYGKLGNDPDPAALAGFVDALQNIGQIGMTFGGGCFFGHGVFLESGQASFQMTSFKVF